MNSTTPFINLASNPPEVNILKPVVTQQLREELQEERERQHWHASDLGYCISGIYYDRLSPKQKRVLSDDDIITFAIGHLMHDFVEKTSERAKILVAKEEDLKVFDEKLQASGRADMMIEMNGKYFLYDLKTVKDKAFYWNTKRGYQANETHKQQIHFYYDNLLSKYKDMTMIVCYISKTFDWGFKFQEIPVEYDPEISKKNTEFFTTLQEAWKTKTPPKPEPDVVWNEERQHYEVNWKSKYCSYHALCTGNANWLKKAEEEANFKNSIPN